jgi:hypothetical protein
MIVMNPVWRCPSDFPVISTNVPLVVSGKAQAPRCIKYGLVILHAKLGITSCSRTLKTNAVVVQIPEVNINPRPSAVMAVPFVVASARLPWIAPIRRRHVANRDRQLMITMQDINRAE